MSMKLYVGNLSFETSSNELQTLFAQTGTVESVSVIEDRETGRSRGFGFIEMSTKEEGAAAIEKFNGQQVGGRALKVNAPEQRVDMLDLFTRAEAVNDIVDELQKLTNEVSYGHFFALAEIDHLAIKS